MAIVEVKNLSKTFDAAGGTTTALNHINLSIEEGDSLWNYWYVRRRQEYPRKMFKSPGSTDRRTGYCGREGPDCFNE